MEQTFRIPVETDGRERSTDGDGPVNPWEHRLNLRWWHYPQIAVMSLTLAPLRMAATLAGELLHWPGTGQV